MELILLKLKNALSRLQVVKRIARACHNSFVSDKVVLIDDLIATGGTMKAAVKLIGSTDAALLGALCLIEIDFLKGKEGIENFVSLIHV